MIERAVTVECITPVQRYLVRSSCSSLSLENYLWEMSSQIPPTSDDGARVLGAKPTVSEDDLNKMIMDNDDEDDDGT